MTNNVPDKLKEIELYLFRLFLEICKKYDLTYFLVGGSCLGAVRHKGYIPWDDDIDVAMPRPDYEKFMSVASEHLPDDVFLQNAHTDGNYPCNFAKLRKSDTAFIEKTVSHIIMNHGVYMDIFPLDGYTNSKLFEIRNRIYTTKINKVFNLGSKMSLMGRVIDILFPMDYRSARDKRDRLFKSIDYYSSGRVVNHCGAWGSKEIVPIEFFGKGTYGEFEGISVLIPEMYHEYLTKLYGEYMELPPEEDRVAHHFCSTIDLGKSYIEYINVK